MNRCLNILHLTDAGLAMVRDGVELLQPDGEEAQDLRERILMRIDQLQASQGFIDVGGGHFKAACETPDCPNPSPSGKSYCETCRPAETIHTCEVPGCDRIPEAGAVCNACLPGCIVGEPVEDGSMFNRPGETAAFVAAEEFFGLGAGTPAPADVDGGMNAALAPALDIADALQIVIDLAKRSASDARDGEAIGIVEDMAVNQFGDD
jgi:hypothetical protein